MNAGERAARERVEAVYAAADRLTPEWAQTLLVPARDMARRDELLDELERDAERSGRGDLLEEARGLLEERLNARAVARFHGRGTKASYPVGGRSEDQVMVLLALMDAVAVAVAEDLVRPEDAAELADPGRRLLLMEPLPGSPVTTEPAGGWQPSESDWAAAADGGLAAVDHEEPYRGGRALQTRFFAAAGAVAAGMALLAGVANGQPVLGLLGAGAVAALAFTFATYRSADRA